MKVLNLFSNISSRSFIVVVFNLQGTDISRINFCVVLRKRAGDFLFNGHSVISMPFVEIAFLYPLNCFVDYNRIIGRINVGLYLDSPLCFTNQFFYLCISNNYCHFIRKLKSSQCRSSSFLFLFGILLQLVQVIYVPYKYFNYLGHFIEKNS